MTTIINMYGGPGMGKSTTSAGLFYLMKMARYEVELVTEYAKSLVWSERVNMFSEQDYITAKQNHALRRLLGKVDWVITDSPLTLGHFYAPADFPGKDHFFSFVDEMYNSYNNINILLKRHKPYNPNGRNQTEQEAIEIDDKIERFLNENNFPYHVVLADEYAPNTIFSTILQLVDTNTDK